MSVCTTTRCQSQLAPCCLIRTVFWDVGPPTASVIRIGALFCFVGNKTHSWHTRRRWLPPIIVLEWYSEILIILQLTELAVEIRRFSNSCLFPFSNYVDSSAWSDYWIKDLGKCGRERVLACFKVLLRHSPGGIEGNHKKSQPRWLAFRSRFEPGVSELPVMNITS